MNADCPANQTPHDAAAGNAVIVAVDFEVCFEHGSVGGPAVTNGGRDLTSDAAHGQVARDLQRPAIDGAHARALEDQFRMARRVEVLGGLQSAIAVASVGCHRGDSHAPAYETCAGFGLMPAHFA